ncbi:MAG: efflux RND transporter periplasmic adaptor subunit [Candidatus Pacebacteria bacterium]|nr:efflux RND transporter periplasmic adaptor subunit [Candidatus Paceibacterota bacterium]MCF7857681.1 efflux RND transporter periplasmic adaptor subunit [Candidatus Paceibacterota bacterium]
MKGFLTQKKYWVIGAVISMCVLWWLMQAFSEQIPEGITIEPVARGIVGEVISETGSVIPVQEVHLAFERGGKVIEILVKEGEEVAEGDVLVKLDATQQRADLIAARARLNAEEFRLEELLRGSDDTSLAVTVSGLEIAKTTLLNAENNLALVTAQQDLLVKNALKTLRSSNLQAYLVDGEQENSERSFVAPIITGTYDSDEDGAYALELYNSSAQSGSSFWVSGLESDTQNVSTVNAVPLGTRGLYVQFPDGFSSRTSWKVPVPNIRANGYLANLNAYNAVLETRNLTVANAESAMLVAKATLAQSRSQLLLASSSARDERVGVQKAVVEQMYAALETAQNSYNNMTITAPFSGVVSKLNTEVGEIVAPTSPAVELISDKDLELLVNISESDIQEIDVDDTATVNFDAYEEIVSNARVVSISPNAKIIEGVHVFEIRLRFNEIDDRIRPGLSANIDISAATREGVIAVPSRAVVTKDSGRFVRVLKGSKIEYIPVTIGLRGSNGMTEIIEGLTEGQKIITFGQQEVIQQLESN